MILYDDECRKAGTDPKKVAAVAQRLERAVKDANQLGLEVFGGMGGGTLRYRDDDSKGPLILADMSGLWDGGDGGFIEDDEGFNRGEYHI
jgi:hypothetical protein